MSADIITNRATPIAPSWWAVTLARGMGQVFFMDKPITGVLMLLGLLVADPWLALFTAVGIVLGTLTATVLRVPQDAVGAGLQGYCAALVGGAAYVTWGVTAAAWISVVVGSAVVVPVTLALAAVLRLPGVRALGLSVLTAPFCIVSGVIVVLARGHVAPAAPLPPVTSSGPLDWVTAVLTGVGQVVFADSPLGGAIILLALFVASWRAGAGALVGAATVTMAASYAFDVAPERIAHGLTQYSAVLVGIAVLAVYLADVRPAWVPWVVAVVGSLATVPVHTWLAAADVPVFTWPFIIVTWVIVGIHHTAQRRD